jgi:long-chain acyl-CoA synthetase
VPAVALSLLERARDHDLSSLELVTYGGAPSPASLPHQIRDRLGALPGQGWGMTETSATCTTHSGEDYLQRPASCGPALPVSRLKVVKHGVEQPCGTAGEVWAFGPNIVKGYWNRPEATAEVFCDGWLKTGDLAWLDDEGFCTILDREQDMLIRGGENIYCVEIEDALLSHPDILDAAVVGIPDRVLGELVGAVVQLKRGAALGPQDVIEHLRPRLAAFKLPVYVDLRTDELPRTASGKIVKTLLRQETADKFGTPSKQETSKQ